MRTSCVSHPKKDRYVIIHKWQIDFCDGDVCAAALLSFFEWGHNTKIEQKERNRAYNNVAEQHGEKRTQDETLYQFHSSEDLSKKLLGIYGTSSIKKARKLLVEKGVISEHGNPNPRYKFDKTTHFLFHPEAVNNYLEVVAAVHRVKITDRSGKNNRSSGESNRSSVKNNRAIPLTPSHTPSQEEDPPISPLGETPDFFGNSNKTSGGEEKNPEPVSSRNKNQRERDAKEVIAYLNFVTQHEYRDTSQIKTCLNAGATAKQCKLVIDWINKERRRTDPGWVESYLDNMTPFRVKNFDKFRAKADAWERRQNGNGPINPKVAEVIRRIEAEEKETQENEQRGNGDYS